MVLSRWHAIIWANAGMFLLTHICITQPQWVKHYFTSDFTIAIASVKWPQGIRVNELHNSARINYWWISNIRCTLLENLQLHLHYGLNNWLQWIGQRQLQHETRINSVRRFGPTYIRDLMVYKHTKTNHNKTMCSMCSFYEMFGICISRNHQYWL